MFDVGSPVLYVVELVYVAASIIFGVDLLDVIHSSHDFLSPNSYIIKLLIGTD